MSYAYDHRSSQYGKRQDSFVRRTRITGARPKIALGSIVQPPSPGRAYNRLIGLYSDFDFVGSGRKRPRVGLVGDEG